MGKTIAIVQSNYIPWKGYFDLINMVDEFILYDEVQYTKNDWRNRNIIKSVQGVHWLTIPVHGKISSTIKEITVANHNWATKHWKSLISNYSKAPFFKEYQSLLELAYDECKTLDFLSEINFKFISLICRILQIKTKLVWSTSYSTEIVSPLAKTDRLIELCKKAGASHYVSGPLARNYIDEQLFQQNGIELRYIDYSNYPVYEQLYDEFTHNVSILDLIFNTGKQVTQYMKSF